MGIVVGANKENCSHVMFDLVRRDPEGGENSAYFLTAEPQDLPSDAKNVRELKVGDILYVEVDGNYSVVHAHGTGRDQRISSFGFPFAESSRVSRGVVAALIFRLQHPADPD